jgi:hypothetical protein
VRIVQVTPGSSTAAVFSSPCSADAAVGLEDTQQDTIAAPAEVLTTAISALLADGGLLMHSVVQHLPRKKNAQGDNVCNSYAVDSTRSPDVSLCSATHDLLRA